MNQIKTSIHIPNSFYSELEQILLRSGISPGRLAISADANSPEKHSGEAFHHDRKSEIGRVIIYINENLTEQLSLEKLAEEANLSKYQLIRRFRDETGSTPWQFLISRRIDMAKELLINGTPPGQAAAETGFYDQSHLHKVFRDETGFTPKEYQEKFFKNKN